MRPVVSYVWSDANRTGTSGLIFRTGLLLLVTLCLVLASGCGERSGESTYVVTGRVTYDGKPLNTGNVMFVPEKGTAATSAISTDGTYKLKTIPGKHRVGVTAHAEPPPDADERTYESPPPLVPPAYMRSDTSGIVKHVEPKNPNQIDLNLEKL